MGRASKQEDIVALMEEIDPTVKVDQNFIYGYTDASLMTYGSLAAVLSMEYSIIVFAEDKLYLLEVSMTGALTGEYGVILYADVESFKVRKGLIQYIVTLKLVGEKKKLKLKCNKNILGMGWQKNNLAFLDSRDWNGVSKLA